MKHTPFTLAREIDEKKPKESVHLASGRFLFGKVCLFVGMAMPGIWLVLGGGWTALISLVIAYLGAMLLTGIPLTYFLKWAYRVRVAPDGIHGGTFWSTPVYMRWSEMETVEARSVIGLPYLRVKSFRESCPTLWLPRFLAHPDGFKIAVTERTSPLNPLRRSLESGSNTAIQSHKSLPQ